MRYNTVLKNIGLKSIFIKLNSQLFPEGVVLQDIVQNVKIIIDNANYKSSNSHKKGGYKTTRKFIANKPFIYYFRLLNADNANNIITIGNFTS